MGLTRSVPALVTEQLTPFAKDRAIAASRDHAGIHVGRPLDTERMFRGIEERGQDRA